MDLPPLSPVSPQQLGEGGGELSKGRRGEGGGGGAGGRGEGGGEGGGGGRAGTRGRRIVRGPEERRRETGLTALHPGPPKDTVCIHSLPTATLHMIPAALTCCRLLLESM